jgi:altronate dehydratase
MRLFVIPLLVVAALSAAETPAVGLPAVRRIYIESLGGTPQAVMLRDMIISCIAGSGLFTITETAERSDAIMRGSARDETFVEEHRSSDSITAGLHMANSQYSSVRNDRTGDSRSRGVNIGQNESMNSAERRHEASASVRLIGPDGDVIWSTTQESLGAKFKSSSADVADKIYKKLAEDLQKARSASMQAGIPSR